MFWVCPTSDFPKIVAGRCPAAYWLDVQSTSSDTFQYGGARHRKGAKSWETNTVQLKTAVSLLLSSSQSGGREIPYITCHVKSFTFRLSSICPMNVCVTAGSVLICWFLSANLRCLTSRRSGISEHNSYSHGSGLLVLVLTTTLINDQIYE